MWYGSGNWLTRRTDRVPSPQARRGSAACRSVRTANASPLEAMKECWSGKSPIYRRCVVQGTLVCDECIAGVAAKKAHGAQLEAATGWWLSAIPAEQRQHA